MNKELTIVKIGGKVIDDEASLEQFLIDYGSFHGQTILVHGGGKIASDIGEKMGIEPVYHEGRRITDKATLDLVTMVYGGLINKKIVATIQTLGINAIGLTGADGNVLKANKRPVKEIDYGFAGDVSVDSVNTVALNKLLNAGFSPVMCTLTHDGNGSILNTNADTIASILAAALSKSYDVVELVYCFEQPGVLEDLESKKVIPHIEEAKYITLKAQGEINEGMLHIMDTALDA